jgi:hypothetical protein
VSYPAPFDPEPWWLRWLAAAALLALTAWVCVLITWLTR